MAALLVFIGMSGLGSGESVGGPAPDEVTITEAAPEDGATSSDSGSGTSVREVYTRDGPGVVSVDVASSEMGPGGGSGFVLDKNGYIVTNQHVVSGADGVSVRFASGARRDAEIVGEDPSTDVAILKVDAPKDTLEPLTLGDSESVTVGDPVIAIGNPLNVGLSVTTGIVSGTGRPIKAPNNYTINDAVQTDAAISSGNSGGPLLDARGAVIGINSQVASAGSNGVAQGVGFAVPINTVKGVVEQLITNGEVVHGYIGVRMFQIGVEELRAYTTLSEQEFRDKYGLPKNGAIVSEVVPNGPADDAGISGGKGDEKEIAGGSVPLGDVITTVDGKRVSDPDDVIEVVNSKKPGDMMDLIVVKPGGEPRNVRVKLGTQPEGA
ncbi:MAG TPA: trypsin-like peptidase domain-containing protein [Rubrobacteraceae bacterium]|nr:trypsin-like peptidase domain-containing protein [Rubrobacteraceae bacterium]